jgi:hypothetical protein
MIANVKQKTIEPFIKETIAPGTLVYTDEYSIYARLCAWGYDHKRVNHGRGEYARDEDGDGFCEVHVNTMEGFWVLVSLTELAPPPSGHFTRKTAALPRFLRVCSQCQKARESAASCAH